MIERIPITDREQWLALREPDITASVIGALFGHHPYVTRFQLFAQKCGLEAASSEETAMMRRGRRMEQAVADEAADIRPEWQITKAQEYLRDPEARIGATPDFYYIDEEGRSGVLQVKTVNPRTFKENWDQVPPVWICIQTLTEMMLADVDIGQIAALVLGDFEWKLELYDVPRNKKAEATLRTAVAQFWDNVAAGNPPPVDYSRDADLINLLYKDVEPSKSIDLCLDNRMPELLARHEELGQSITKMEKEKKAVAAEIIEKMGNAEVGIVPGWRLTNKRITVEAYTKQVDTYSYPRLYIKRMTNGKP